MKYLLDTNTCIYIINKKPRKVLNRLRASQPGSVAISMIGIAEIYYGAYQGDEAYRTKNLQAVQLFLTPFAALPFEQSDAEQFGKFKALLRQHGTMLPDLDIAIAAQASTRKLILVTNDTRHFKQVPGLKIVNWSD